MKRVETLTDSLKGTVDMTRYLATLTGNDDQRIPGFWVRTTEEFSKAITQKLIKEYNNPEHPNNQNYPSRITPDELRFPGIRKQIMEIYEIEEDILSRDFISTVDGKAKLNSEWIKINRNSEDDGFGIEDEKMEQSIRENAGYKITATSYTKEERRQGKVDVELPLSIIFRASQWVDNKRKGMSPRFPYLFFYYVFNMFVFVVGKDKVAPSILKAIEDIWERRDKLLELPKNKMNLIDEATKDRIAPLINGNKETFGALHQQITSGRPKMTDQNVDKIAEECDKAIDIFTSNQEMDLAQVISKLSGSNEEQTREVMSKFGFSQNNIQKVMEGVTNGMSNDELKATIPGIDGMQGMDFDKLMGK